MRARQIRKQGVRMRLLPRRFDGNGYVISDLYINRKDEDFVGLISRLVGDARAARTAKIRRLGLVDFDITGGKSVGGLAGFKNLAWVESSFVTGHVTVEVFDITGRHVATLVDRPMPPGEHTTEFEAAVLSSGIYVYRIQAGDFVRTRRMSLVK